jgi:integrase
MTSPFATFPSGRSLPIGEDCAFSHLGKETIVDRSVIALWLGHESVETTQIYLEATLSMKEQALAKVTPLSGKLGRYRPGDRLMSFLNSL